jgi:hypothetical protein
VQGCHRQTAHERKDDRRIFFRRQAIMAKRGVNKRREGVELYSEDLGGIAPIVDG